MRVNVYAEEMTPQVEIISKKIEGQDFTGVRFWLALPASFHVKPAEKGSALTIVPASETDTEQAHHMQAPFIHSPGDNDSSAVTFWGKRDLRGVLKSAIELLDKHYAARDETRQVRVENEVAHVA